MTKNRVYVLLLCGQKRLESKIKCNIRNGRITLPHNHRWSIMAGIYSPDVLLRTNVTGDTVVTPPNNISSCPVMIIMVV